jgi:hypothetical protein
LALQGGCQVAPPGVYQMPITLLFPKRTEVSNLLVPVCNSASHVAYATVRMEPQFMILGHAAGVVAALVASNASNGGDVQVQDVDVNTVAALLLADGQIISGKPPSPTYGKFILLCLCLRV